MSFTQSMLSADFLWTVGNWQKMTRRQCKHRPTEMWFTVQGAANWHVTWSRIMAFWVLEGSSQVWESTGCTA